MNLKSNNPFLKNKSFTQTSATTAYDEDGRPVEIIDFNNTMTVNGAITKSFILLLLLVGSALYTWWSIDNGQNGLVLGIIGLFAGAISVLVTVFKPNLSPYLAPAYAIFEGLFIGFISWYFEQKYSGLVIQAVFATFVTFFVCLALYRFKIVKVTEQFKSIVIASTMAIGTYYLISIICSFFGVTLFHHGNSLMSIGFSVFVIVVAALNLFLDFDLIEESAQKRMPKFMEWFGAMGLIITLVWLYIEFLRLLSKLRD